MPLARKASTCEHLSAIERRALGEEGALTVMMLMYRAVDRSARVSPRSLALPGAALGWFSPEERRRRAHACPLCLRSGPVGPVY